MKESVKEACLALFDGNRDAVLKLFPTETDEILIVWLKANAVEEPDEKKRLLEQILIQPFSEYQNMAAVILERENHYADELAIPPSYKFWEKRRKRVNA